MERGEKTLVSRIQKEYCEESKMKRVLIMIAVAMIAVTGCKQQPGQPAGQAPNPGIAMKTPDEIRQLEGFARQSPKNAQAWIALGNALMDSGRYGEAVPAYEKALALEPKNVNVRVDMGTCLRNSGRPEQALKELPRPIYGYCRSGGRAGSLYSAALRTAH